MAKEIDKIIQSKTAPKSNNVLWDDGENLKINRNGKWESAGGGAPMINITYANLVELRNNSKLIAGMQYRITDYVTTTAQENTRSAGHQFDVIVTADNANTLNEVARACKSEFDIEKYKDAYSSTWAEKILYVGQYEYEGKEYHLYESESQDMQMLVDFNNIVITDYNNTIEYPYTCYSSYYRIKENMSWGNMLNPQDDGEVISFKHNPTEATYFNSSNLAAWQIWYSLDNDTERFVWASNKEAISNGDSIYYRNPSLDTTNNDVLYYAWLNEYENVTLYTIKEIPTEGDITYNDIFDEDCEIIKVITKGKGVIYRMIDEWNNDCPYDFKNIQFKRNLIFENGYAEYSEDGEETWVYTFAGQSYHIDNDEWSDMLDGSLESPYGHMSDENMSTFHNNIIKPYIKVYDDDEIHTEYGRCYLNNIVLLGYWEKIGSSTEEYEYFMAICCTFNTFDNNCHSNSLSNGCKCNIFGNHCYNNILGYDCSYNTFNRDCQYNTLSDNCYYNSLDNNCTNVKLNKNTGYKIASINSNYYYKVFNLADLADLLNS